MGEIQTHAMIETGVICLREGNHQFTSPLVAPVHPDTSFCEPRGVHQSDELEEEIWLSLEKVGRFTLDSSLELLGILPWNAVPRLRLTPVHCVVVRTPKLQKDKANLL
jgi:hypothetical protein